MTSDLSIIILFKYLLTIGHEVICCQTIKAYPSIFKMGKYVIWSYLSDTSKDRALKTLSWQQDSSRIGGPITCIFQACNVYIDTALLPAIWGIVKILSCNFVSTMRLQAWVMLPKKRFYLVTPPIQKKEFQEGNKWNKEHPSSYLCHYLILDEIIEKTFDMAHHFSLSKAEKWQPVVLISR